MSETKNSLKQDIDHMNPKLKEEILNGNHGSGVKFILRYGKDLFKLDESILNGCNQIFEQFKKKYNELKLDNPTINSIFSEIESKNSNIPSHLIVEHEKNENGKKLVKKKTTIKKKKNKHDTTVDSQVDPIDAELKSLVQNASDLLGPNITKLSIKKEKVSSSFVKKKPSFKNKSIESNDSNITSCSITANVDTTANLTKTVVKTEITLERNDTSSKIKKQPSKKMRLAQKEELENIDEEENSTNLDQGETRTIKKKNSTKKKHRKSSTTAKKNTNQLSVFKMPEPLATSSLSTTLINNLKEINAIANTPNTKLHKELTSESTNSKTIKAKQVEEEEESKPMTRRAAAAAAAIAAENKVQPKNKVLEDIAKTIHASGKVKQMVELHEARIKPYGNTLNTPPTVQKPHAIRQLQYTNSKFKTTNSTSTSISNNTDNSKIRSSIDKRKIRISNQKAKAENKRQSVKKVAAFLKDLSESQSSGVSVKSEKLSFPNTDEINESLLDTQSIKSEPSVSHQASAAPNTQQLASTVKKLNNHFLASSSTVQQQYKVANTPGFNKFLERNTPNKMSRSELELKRKAELVSKEKKELERLHERDKQLQEKIEIARKKREERMKKIAELKAKKEEEELKKKEEIQAKLREVEEHKKRILEEKKREEYEKQKAREQRIHQQPNTTSSDHMTSNVNKFTNLATPQHPKPHTAIHTSASQTSNPYSKTNLMKQQQQQQQQQNHHHQQNNHSNNQNSGYTHLIKPSQTNNNENNTNKNLYENLSTFKSAQQFQQANKNMTPLKSSNVVNQQSALETTYSKPTNHPVNNTFNMDNHHSQKPTTPYKETIQRPVIKNQYDNYEISDLRSEDETDDDEEPSKPVPQWAREVLPKARQQALNKINFTQLFKSTSQNEIILDNIFRVKRKKFYERSSSANWDTPPIWKTGINGNESFRQLHN